MFLRSNPTRPRPGRHGEKAGELRGLRPRLQVKSIRLHIPCQTHERVAAQRGGFESRPLLPEKNGSGRCQRPDQGGIHLRRLRLRRCQTHERVAAQRGGFEPRPLLPEKMAPAAVSGRTRAGFASGGFGYADVKPTNALLRNAAGSNPALSYRRGRDSNPR